jgi:type VI secretion system protein
MNEFTLLERLVRLDKSAGRPDMLAPQEALERSLARHLSALLNTRRGAVPIAPDYGIGDVTDLGRSFTEESIHEFTSGLERMLLRYEPRLSKVRVNYTPRKDVPLAAFFDIEATIATEYGEQVLRFETMLDATGAARLTRGDG